jgi:signal transduction histidine kinase
MLEEAAHGTVAEGKRRGQEWVFRSAGTMTAEEFAGLLAPDAGRSLLGGLAGRYGSWLWSAADRVDGSGPATYAMKRVAALVASLIRGSTAVAGGIAAWVGLSSPALPSWVVVAVIINSLWAAIFVTFALTHGLTTWAMTCDVTLIALYGIFQTRLAGSEPLTDGSSWVAAAATMTIVTANLTWRTCPAVIAGVGMVGSYLIGASSLPGHGIYQMVTFSIQIGSAAALMALVRGASRAADVALADYEQTRRAALVEQARRTEEREQNRRLHDTVLATLTMVGTGAIAESSETLRGQASRDLTVIAGLAVAADRRDDMVSLDRLLVALAEQIRPRVDVVLSLTPCIVPRNTANAFTAAATEALTNVARHSGVSVARMSAYESGSVVTVEVADEGAGFDPSAIPAHRYGLREAIAGRMHTISGTACIESAVERGTRVTLRWPR